MTLHVLDGALTYRGRLTNFRSLRWSEEYRGPGAFSLVCDDTDENAALLAHGSFLCRADRKTAMQVVSIVRNGEQRTITASGYTTLHLLNRRVIIGTYPVDNIEAAIHRIVRQNLRALPGIDIAPEKGFTDQWIGEIADGEMIKTLAGLCKQGDIGMRMTLDIDRKRHVFETYRGKDWTYREGAGGLVFSKEFGNLLALTVTEDDDLFKSAALVIGQATDGARVLVTVGDATGDDRREMIVQGGAQDNAETDAQFVARLTALGQEQLWARYRVKTFQASISPEQFAVAYDLGDKVTCNATRYGLRFDTRITAFTHTIEKGAQKITITLGEMVVTYIKGEMIKHG